MLFDFLFIIVFVFDASVTWLLLGQVLSGISTGLATGAETVLALRRQPRQE